MEVFKLLQTVLQCIANNRNNYLNCDSIVRFY